MLYFECGCIVNIIFELGTFTDTICSCYNIGHSTSIHNASEYLIPRHYLQLDVILSNLHSIVQQQTLCYFEENLCELPLKAYDGRMATKDTIRGV